MSRHNSILGRSTLVMVMSLTMVSGARRARADTEPQDPPKVLISSSVDQYVALFANYYQVLDGLVTIADFLYNRDNGQPSLANLLAQIEDQIVSRLLSRDDDHLTWSGQSVASRFHEVLMNPTLSTNDQTVEDLLNEASNTRISMMNIITGGTAEEAYRLAPHFVALTAVYVAMQRYRGYVQASINDRLTESVQIDYALVGTEDAFCGRQTGVQTNFDSVLFRRRLTGVPYLCSIQWQCKNSTDPGLTIGQTYSCTVASGGGYNYANCTFFGDVWWESQPFGVTSPLGGPSAPSALAPDCETQIANSLQPCRDETVAWATGEFNADLVVALVRNDMTQALSRLGSITLPGDAICPAGLFLPSWNQLCSTADCAAADLAFSMPASQSSTYGGYASAARAVDGITDGNFSDGSVTHTDFENAWWQIDLGYEPPVGQVSIWNRTDCCSDRLANFSVLLSHDGYDWYYLPGAYVAGAAAVDGATNVDLGGTRARYVRIQLESPNYLSLAEVLVFMSQDAPP